MTNIKLAVFISGKGSNLHAIIRAIQNRQLNAEIVVVFSNRPQAQGLEIARKHHIPTLALDHKDFSERQAFDQEIIRQIDPYKPDFLILAGFMRILTDEFIQHYWPNILNIHPSLLPKYQGLNTHQRVLENDDREHGVSVHMVTHVLDSGHLIAQGSFPVNAKDDIDSLQRKGHQMEHIIYPQVLQWLAQERLQISDGIPIFDGEVIHEPINISQT